MHRDTRLPARSHARPILLVHGFASSPRIMSPLARWLTRALRREVVSIPLAAGSDDLRDSARELHDAVAACATRSDFEFVDVVAHSMGGLTATYLLKALDRGRRVRTVVTLGTPHRGTPLARLGALVFGTTRRAIWQMIPGCEFLEGLARMGTPSGSQVVSISGGRDRIVPVHSARVATAPRQHNLELPDIGHTDLLLRRDVFAHVRSALTQAAIPDVPARTAMSADPTPLAA